jgi:hypothetical protein
MLTVFRPVPLVFGSERRLLERSGYRCESCGVPVVADPDRRMERIDPVRGDADHNLRLVCGRCAAGRADSDGLSPGPVSGRPGSRPGTPGGPAGHGPTRHRSR